MTTPVRSANERGLLSTELAILMPVLVVAALVAVLLVQVQRHDAHAQAAADSAARAASYADTADEAAVRATAAAQRVCADSTAVVASWNPPDEGALRPGRVVIELTCRISYDGFAVLGAGGVRQASATGVSSIEYWRST